MMMRTRPSRLRILSRLRLLAVLVLPLALLVLPATRSVADPAGDSPLGPLDAARIGTTMQSHDAAIESDRHDVLTLLRQPAVRSIASDAGLDVGRAEARVRAMNGDQLARVAPQAREAMQAIESAQAIHGADTLVISATTLIIVLLIIILILVLAD